MKLKNEVLRLTKLLDGSIECASRTGQGLMMPTDAAEALERYFDEGQKITYIVGGFFAPMGSAKASKLRIVGKALESQHWKEGKNASH